LVALICLSCLFRKSTGGESSLTTAALVVLMSCQTEVCVALSPAWGLRYEARAHQGAFRTAMFPKPKPALAPNTYAYESEPLVKPTGFREYDVRWLLEKEINLMGVQALGLGLGTLIHELGASPQVVTGHDFR